MKIYFKTWYTAACAAAALQNYLNLLHQRQEYRSEHKVIAYAAMQSFSRHLWYLSETLRLPSAVPVAMKRSIFTALDKDGEQDPPLRRKPILVTSNIK
jgi:hypothetical protein